MTDGQPSRLTNEALLAGLAAHAIELERSAKELRAAYHFSRQLKVIFGIGALLITGLIVIALLSLRNNTAIRSCTTPEGDCYQRGQQSTAEAVAQIVAEVNAHTNLVLIATLECSPPHTSGPELAACLQSKGIR